MVCNTKYVRYKCINNLVSTINKLSQMNTVIPVIVKDFSCMRENTEQNLLLFKLKHKQLIVFNIYNQTAYMKTMAMS